MTSLRNKPEWREVHQALPLLERFVAGDADGHGMRTLVGGALRYLDDLLDHHDAGGRFVWHNLGFSPELIYALGGVRPLCVEALGAMHSLFGNQARTLDFIDASEAAGLPGDCCSADKIAAGAAHRGALPPPVCSVGINTPCDAQVAGTQVMAELGGAPFFVVDVPTYRGEDTVRHVAAQLKELLAFLERHTGRRVDVDRLRHVCATTNAMTEAIWDWLEWRKVVPLPQSSKVIGLALAMHVLFAGTQRGVEAGRALAREARERAERQERHFEERVRAIWYQDPVWWDLQIYDWFERDLGLTVPVDVFGYLAQEALIDTATVDTMLHGLARKLASCHPMARQFRSDIDVYIGDFMRMVEGWSGDCGIFAGHVSCKHAWGGIGLFREACRKADIPLLVFEFDMFDPRVTSFDEVFFQVERFVNEIVLPRKRRAAARGGRR